MGIVNVLDYYLKEATQSWKITPLTTDIIMKVNLTQEFKKMNKYEFQIRDPNKSIYVEHTLVDSDISV